MKWTDHASSNLAKRIEDFKRTDEAERKGEKPDKVTATIQSLHTTAARASYVLPALYLAEGARSLPTNPAPPHSHAVRAALIKQTMLHNNAITCRADFNDTTTDDLSGRRIGRMSDETRAAVAAYWSRNSKRSEDEATQALVFLQDLFAQCARSKDELLDQPSRLERRIGLLKYYANRSAAHVTLDYYIFHTFDVVHVVAAIVLIGAIIVDFDEPQHGARYFDSVDLGGWHAAKEIFPHLPMERIFKGWKIHQRAASMWSLPGGVTYILDELPAAIGWPE
jgi:hypothetical protein